jgi:tRNA 2-thiouridine synthesizing protein A
MSKKELDLRGLTCPQPVLATKKLLDDASVQEVRAIVDDQINVNNLTRLANYFRAQISVAQKNDSSYLVTISRSAQADHGDAQAEQIQQSQLQIDKAKTGVVVFLTKDMFGEGDLEFSRTLINLFLQTIYESGQRPDAILMANTGVKLMAKANSCRKVLDDFREAGSEVLACGLCVEFYKLKEEIPVNQITSMFNIVEYLFACGKVLSP